MFGPSNGAITIAPTTTRRCPRSARSPPPRSTNGQQQEVAVDARTLSICVYNSRVAALPALVLCLAWRSVVSTGRTTMRTLSEPPNRLCQRIHHQLARQSFTSIRKRDARHRPAPTSSP